jgi:hypothetical protein
MALRQSVDRLDRGEGADGGEVFRQLRKRMRHPKYQPCPVKTIQEALTPQCLEHFLFK